MKVLFFVSLEFLSGICAERRSEFQGAARKGGVIKGGVCKRKRTHANADKRRFFRLSEKPKTQVNARKRDQTQRSANKRKINELQALLRTLIYGSPRISCKF